MYAQFSASELGWLVNGLWKLRYPLTGVALGPLEPYGYKDTIVSRGLSNFLEMNFSICRPSYKRSLFDFRNQI